MVKRIIFFSLTLFMSALVSHAQISAKRKAPKEVAPLVIGGIKYTATTDQIGYVVARDIVTDTVIWKKQIYTIRYNKHLERDVQDVFIDTLNVKGDSLLIHTERGRVYVLKIR